MWWWWSDKDNDVPALHALIEPLYPLIASLVPVLNTLSSYSTFSSSEHDNHYLTMFTIIIIITIIVVLPISISSFSQVLCYPLFKHLSSNSLPIVLNTGLLKTLVQNMFLKKNNIHVIIAIPSRQKTLHWFKTCF